MVTPVTEQSSQKMFLNPEFPEMFQLSLLQNLLHGSGHKKHFKINSV